MTISEQLKIIDIKILRYAEVVGTKEASKHREKLLLSIRKACEECLEASRLETEKYNELILAVENKYPNETRHQTALRFIKEYQKSDNVLTIA